VYVADYFESRVKRLAKNGDKWIDVAGQNDEMNLTRGVWVDNHGNVFATDCGNSRVLKYAPHSSVAIVVAGGNGYGNALNQLARPASVVLDNEENMYIADENNHRVVKWAPGATSGVVVAGNGSGVPGTEGNPINHPLYGSVVQQSGGVSGNEQPVILYISDKTSNSVQLWLEGASTGTIFAGGNGRGDDSDQLNRPFANFVFDHYLFVADRDNARIQRFDLNEEIINTQFTAIEPGTYSVTATFSNGCVISSNNIRVTESCNESFAISAGSSSNASTAEGNLKNAFAYPNPADNMVTINFSAKQNGKYILELTELSGKILLHKEVNALPGINNTALDVSRFAKGIYFINITGADKQKQSIKLSKE
jgi:hypothetical protein